LFAVGARARLATSRLLGSTRTSVRRVIDQTRQSVRTAFRRSRRKSVPPET